MLRPRWLDNFTVDSLMYDNSRYHAIVADRPKDVADRIDERPTNQPVQVANSCKSATIKFIIVRLNIDFIEVQLAYIALTASHPEFIIFFQRTHAFLITRPTHHPRIYYNHSRMSLCPSSSGLTSESLNQNISLLARKYIFVTSRSRWSIKVMRSKSRSF